jgi:hypothetical protein
MMKKDWIDDLAGMLGLVAGFAVVAGAAGEWELLLTVLLIVVVWEMSKALRRFISGLLIKRDGES